MYKLISFAFILFAIISEQNVLLAQKELQLNLASAEAIFLQNNLQLIAEKYNVNIAEANIIQAKLFENPLFTFEQNVYSNEDEKYFDFSKENVIKLEQLFKLAGKRNKQVNLEKINVEIAKFQFDDLLRTLKNTLRATLIEAYYLQKSTSIYEKEISYLQKLIDVYERQYEKGNIALAEKARLKALLFTLKNERLDIEKQIIDANKDINLLLNQPEQTIIKLTLNVNSIQSFNFDVGTFNSLINELKNTTQMQILNKQIQVAEANIKLQKSLRIPDLTLGLAYERTGEWHPNNVVLSFNIPLPIFNRNQGEINIAEAQLDQSKMIYQQQEKELSNELFAIYNKAKQTLDFYKNFDNDLENDFEKLIEGISANFERKSISLVDFIDFYEKYKETSLLLQNVEKETILSIEAINFLLGKNLFNVVN